MKIKVSFFPHLISWTQEKPTHELVGKYSRLEPLSEEVKLKRKKNLTKQYLGNYGSKMECYF